MANQFNLFFYCVFVTLIFASNGVVSDNGESTKNIIKLFNIQDDHFNPPVEDVMLSDSTDCDCGPNSVNCIRNSTTGGRNCKCNDGYAPMLKGIDETCEKCDCGEFGVSCKFDENGRKQCTCIKGYGPKYEDPKLNTHICAKCDCGDNGIECKLFSQGKKYCRCQLGNYTDFFIEKTDKKCKECNCGPNGVSCDFDSRKNTFCKCAEGYSSEKISEDDGDEYCKRCDCGVDGLCNVKVVDNRSVKQCNCYKGYKEFEGKCKLCDCGSHSVNCTFYKYKGTQMCGCEEGYVTKESYVWKDEYCDRCDCGEFGLSCSFLFGYRRCTCKEGYTSDVIAGNNDDYCVKDTWLSGWVIGILAVAGVLLLTVAGIIIGRLIARSRLRR